MEKGITACFQKQPRQIFPSRAERLQFYIGIRQSEAARQHENPQQQVFCKVELIYCTNLINHRP
jgi:hypothetical protein